MRKTFISGLKNWWKEKSIRDQIFLSMSLVIILAIGILGNVAYKFSADAIEENYRQSYESTLENSSRVLDMNLRNIIEEVRSFLNEPGLQQVMRASGAYGGSKFTTEDQESLKTVAEGLTEYQSWVNSVSFMDLHGHYYQLSNINVGTYNFYQYYQEHSFLDEEWSKKAGEAQGKEVFFGKNILGYQDDDGLSMAKYMINPSTGEAMGYVVVCISEKILAKSFVVSQENSQQSSYMIVDENEGSTAIYFQGDSQAAEDIVREYPLGNRSGTYVFSSVKNDTTGWDIVNVISKNELSRESKAIRMAVFLCGGAVIVLCFILARAISRTITRPLQQLEMTISKVGEGERHITEEFDNSEAGRIGQEFKEMVNTNLELSEHLMSVELNEREAQVLLLQSQINPHFLYNTLDSLYFMAIMHGDDQIANMTMALSDYFKLTLNNGEKYISVADSIEWIRKYIQIQNLRYHDRFELSVDVAREIFSRKILSFILQPFVENAIYHGLEPKMGKGRISVLGWQEGNDMVFVVEDDGVGIHDMSVLDKGYGIRNVRERIRLHYGENYGAQVESREGKGTKVTITVPAGQETGSGRTAEIR